MSERDGDFGFSLRFIDRRTPNDFETDAELVEIKDEPVFRRGQRVWFYGVYPGPVMGTIQLVSRIAKQESGRNALVECYRYVLLLDGDTHTRNTDDPNDMKPTLAVVSGGTDA